MPYTTPDTLAHVYAFAHTVEDAQRIALMANREGATRKGKFVPGTFVVTHIEGRLPAVTGTLTGNGPDEAGRVQYSPRYATAADTVEALRERATELAVRCLQPQKMTKAGWRNKRPIDQTRLSRALDTTCTCIELVTVNGNYARERSEALRRAAATKEVK